jgi:hypothetical protein
VDILASAQPSPTHTAAIEDMGEGPLDQFAAPAHRRAPDSGSQPRSVGVDGSLRRLVAKPTQIALGRLRFGDARLPDAAFKSAVIDAGRLHPALHPDARRACALLRPRIRSQRRRRAIASDATDRPNVRQWAQRLTEAQSSAGCHGCNPAAFPCPQGLEPPGTQRSAPVQV